MRYTPMRRTPMFVIALLVLILRRPLIRYGALSYTDEWMDGWMNA